MPAENERRALILDFDGVLVNSEPLHHESWLLAYGELPGISLEGAPPEVIGLSLEATFARWEEALGLTFTNDEREALLARKTAFFYELGAERLRPIAGSVELIRRAQALGWYVAIVSRARRRRLHGTLAVMQMPALFDLVLGCEDGTDPVSDRKDHAIAARIFGIDPARCVVVEDSTSGVSDALACGIGRVIGLTTSISAELLCDAGAHEVVDRLELIRFDDVVIKAEGNGV